MKEIHNYVAEAVVTLHKEFNKNHESKRHNNKVRLGRSASLSSCFERSMAEQLSKAYPAYKFFVDYPVTAKTIKGIQLGTIYPDIMVVENLEYSPNSIGNVVALLDLKIDLGYLDLSYYNLEETKNKKSKKVIKNGNLKNSGFLIREDKISKAKELKFNYIVGAYSDDEKDINNKKGPLYATISKGFKKISIVCSGKNHTERKKCFIDLMNKNGYSAVILMDDIHPNTSDDQSDAIKKCLNKKKDIINNIFEF